MLVRYRFQGMLFRLEKTFLKKVDKNKALRHNQATFFRETRDYPIVIDVCSAFSSKAFEQ